jgi:Ca2+/Na+ antiporter
MTTIFDTIISNPFYMGIILVKTFFIIYSIIKKIIKLFFLFIVLLILYIFYLHYTGNQVPKTVDDFKKSISKNAEKVKSIASKSLDEAKQTTKKIVEEKIDKKVNELFNP